MTARKPKTSPKTDAVLARAPLLEWVTAIFGLVASVGAIGYLAWEGFQPQDGPPLLSASTQEVFATPTGFVVAVRIVNQSRMTASAVQVEGSLGGEAALETANLTFDYVPGKGRREGSMTFKADPRKVGLTVSVKGQITP